MSKKNTDLEALRANLDAPHAERFDSFVTDLQAGKDAKVLGEQFLAWATPLFAEMGLPHPGALWGELKRRFAPKGQAPQIESLTTLADRFPYPLGYKLRALLQSERRLAEGEAAPQYPFELCAVMGVLVRLSAIVAIRAYVESGGKDTELNHLIVQRLRAPSDGGWLELAQRIGKTLPPDATPLARMMADSLKQKPKLPKDLPVKPTQTNTQAALQALVKFRNDLVHGEPVTHLIGRARADLEVAVRGFLPLCGFRLEVRFAGKSWSLSGAVPQPVEEDSTLPEGEPCLVHREGAHPPFSLSPLLRFRPSSEEDVDVDFDELFFLNAGSAEQLNYIGYRATGQMDGKSLGSYESFKEMLAKIPTPPIPENPKLDFADLAAFHAKLFVGRQRLLEEIGVLVRDKPSQYGVMKALAGMGKSAVFASLYQAVRNHKLDEGSRIPCAADAIVRAEDIYAFHFCATTGGRNSSTLALRSLISQICDAFGIERSNWLSHDIEDLKDARFPGLLSHVAEKLNPEQRLVVVVDALDEGIGSEKETVANCIPAGEYPGVVFLLSYRVDETNANKRVEQDMRLILPERRQIFQNADPLRGLEREDVRAYLDKVAQQMEKPLATDEVEEAVWEAASKGSDAERPSADPFYLRFIADGVQNASVRLDRPETIPESLDDAFEEMWMGLPQERDFLCHRILLMLGILREYGEDELLAEILNLERPADHKLVPDDITAARVQAGKLLVYDGDKYGLFHDRFKRFLVGIQKDPLIEAMEDAA